MTRDPYAYARKKMVRDHIMARGVQDPRVLQAVSEAPRHFFVREHLHGQAYADFALPIGEEQTISQPYVVARMSEMLDIHPDHSVLEIGTGSAYQTYILARLAHRVYSLERIGSLVRQAIVRMRELRVENVKIQTFDGTVGWSDVGPFDRIMVTAGAPQVPQPLLDQLKVGGKLVVPEGPRDVQHLVLYEKTPQGIRKQVGEAVSFVPLIGRHGWAKGS